MQQHCTGSTIRPKCTRIGCTAYVPQCALQQYNKRSMAAAVMVHDGTLHLLACIPLCLGGMRKARSSLGKQARQHSNTLTPQGSSVLQTVALADPQLPQAVQLHGSYCRRAAHTTSSVWVGGRRCSSLLLD